jgi:HTH-type transcriptional regulator/antitoxin HigA
MGTQEHKVHEETTDDEMLGAASILVSPGEILKEELEARGWTQKDLATVMGRPTQAISEIISAVKQITPQTALELADALGTTAEVWTNLEADYRLSLARARGTDDEIARRARMFSLAPINELLRRGWLAGADDLAAELCQFLGMESLADSPKAPARLRASLDRGPEQPAIIAWMKRAEWLASKQQVGRYDAAGLEASLDSLARLSVDPSRAADVPALLATYGVHFVVVQHLPKTYLDGASFWLEGRPVVAVTLRYDRIDSFWFTVMHEIGHVLLGHEGSADRLFDADIDIDPEEQAASAFANAKLFPADRYAEFADALDFAPNLGLIERAAKAIDRHPGLLIGHLQFSRRLGYGQGRTQLVKVSPYLADIIDTPAAA